MFVNTGAADAWNAACETTIMAAAVPPRPSLLVPRPSPSVSRRAPAKSEPRLQLQSVDLESVEENDGREMAVESASHQRATLLRPLGKNDPLEGVVRALRGVSCERAVEAACVCIAACAKAVGCRAAIVHLWDPREENFVIVYSLGSGGSLLLNARHGAHDPLLDEAFAKRAPRVMNFEGARASLARHAVVGGAWSVLVAPVGDDHAPLAAIELIDPLDGSCFDDRHVAAARYTAQRLGELLRAATSAIGMLIAPGD